MELLLMFLCATAILATCFFQIRLTMALIEKVNTNAADGLPDGWDQFDLYSKDYFERMMGSKNEPS